MIALREQSEGMAHSEKLATFVTEVFKEVGVSLSNLSALAISAGPGSYTGLRIGASLAKGLCFPYAIPLIALDSLQIMASHFLSDKPTDFSEDWLCPIIDARRIEVFSALFDTQLNTVISAYPAVLSQNFLGKELSERKIHFLGSGTNKTQEFIKNANAVFHPQFQTSAVGMVKLSYNAFVSNHFVDLACFEPKYLKEAFTTTPKIV